MTVYDLPAVNAALNIAATLLLILGYVQIRRRQEIAHRNTMLAAFGVSIAFLVCYLYYHAYAGHVRFQGPPLAKAVYLPVLFSHIVLAAAVPFLAILTIYFGFRNRRLAHRKVARWTFPIWLYVSVTGVFIYVMLYQLYPSKRSAGTIEELSNSRPPAAVAEPRADL